MSRTRSFGRAVGVLAIAGVMSVGAVMPVMAVEPADEDAPLITAEQTAAAMEVWEYVQTHDWGRVLPLNATPEAHAENSRVAFDYWAQYPMSAAKAQYGCEIEMMGNVIEYVPDVGAELHTVTFRGEGDCDRAINPDSLVRVEALPETEQAAAAAFLASGMEDVVGEGETSRSDGEPVQDAAWNDSCGRFSGVEACLGRGSPTTMLAFGLKNVGSTRIVAYSLVGQATSITGSCAPHSALATTEVLPISPNQYAQTRVSQNARWYNAVYLSPGDVYQGRHCAVV